MIEFGNTLKAAREAKGYSIRQLAEMTRLAPTTVQELEAENISRIAAPIYGRGFVRLYCEAVGLDPKPLIDEFMELYNGNRDSVIKERPVAASLPTEEATAAEPPPSENPAICDPVDLNSEPPVRDQFRQEPEPTPAPETPHPEDTRTEEASRQEPAFSRYAAPVHQSVQSSDLHTHLRLGILAVAALLLLGLLLFGIRAVYHATTATPKDDTPASAVVGKPTPPAATPVAERTAPRTPQKIPSLYID